MASSSPSSSERPEFTAFVVDEATQQLVQEQAAQHGWSANDVKLGGVSAAVRIISSGACPRIIVVDLSESPDPRADMQALAEVCDPDTAVVAFGELNDAKFFRDLIHAGVQDYLVKPVEPETLQEALFIASESFTQVEEEIDDPSKVTKVAIVGLRGGLGASTLAANMASAFAQEAQTILLDLDLYFGVGALLFDLEPGRGLPDALDNPTRVDGLFLERAIVKSGNGPAILAAEAPMGSIGRPANDAAQQVIDALGDNFKRTIVDLPRHTLAEQHSVLEALTDIVLVTDLSLAGARDCIRLTGYVEKVAPSAKIHVVVMKGLPGVDEIAIKDFENSIDHKIAEILPFEAKTIQQASADGKMVIQAQASSKLGQAMRSLFGQICPPDGDAPSASNNNWLKKFFS